MRAIRAFSSGLLGGIAIGLGCFGYFLMNIVSYPLFANLSFTLGFLAIVIFDAGIFTNHSSTVIEKKRTAKNIIKILITLIGNWVGALFIGFISHTKLHTDAFYSEFLNSYPQSSKALFLLFLESILCGMLIYIGLHGYRKSSNSFSGALVLCLCTMLIGAFSKSFSIFNAFMLGTTLGYPNLTSSVFASILSPIFVAALGNFIGTVIVGLLYKLKDLSSGKKHSSNKGA